MYNILFLGGAKRVSMARYFKAAAHKLGSEAKIFSYELDTHVPISIEGTVIKGLKWSDPAIYDDLMRVIDKYGINVVVPFVDTAISVAANLEQKCGGKVFAPTSDAAVAELLFDKVGSAKRFEELEIPIPKTVNCITQANQPIRLIAKPAHGSASKGLIMIDTIEQFEKTIAHDGEYLIQERFDNREEYTVDCYASRQQQILCVVPRLRIDVSGGEVTRTATVIHPEVYDLAKSVLNKLPLQGAITIQVLVDKDTGKAMLMEINPRLGGGAVCSVAAQADIPELILREAAALPLQPVCYRPYTEITRYPQEVIFYN